MIFWKHIKGLSPVKDTNSRDIYTFLRFSETSGQDISEKNMTSLPKIYLSNQTAFSNENDCGHILTSEMFKGSIKNPFTFEASVTLLSSTNSLTLSFGQPNWLLESDNTIRITGNTEIGGTLLLENAVSITDDTQTTALNTGALKVAGGISVQKNIQIGGTAKIGNKCEADYFNATSDYRAKKDFKLLDIDALELIKKVQLYSFKYKESNQPSIGIIAQDVQDIDINGFELVDNKEASGANFDYMSIHESKLVYILWKAIQEQQKEIEELKKLIK